MIAGLTIVLDEIRFQPLQILKSPNLTSALGLKQLSLGSVRWTQDRSGRGRDIFLHQLSHLTRLEELNRRRMRPKHEKSVQWMDVEEEEIDRDDSPTNGGMAQPVRRRLQMLCGLFFHAGERSGAIEGPSTIEALEAPEHVMRCKACKN
ncbi:hypothetical protein BGZ83_011421 [Gryganskiella cystojenkinii]|nr:hypothetical protein BGZ83_011421 [Gryganskiella cystojenkinii]